MPVSSRKRFGRGLVVASVMAFSTAGSAFAQASPEMTAMSNRLSQLERQIQTLSRQVSRAGLSSSHNTPSSPVVMPAASPVMQPQAQGGAVPGAADATMGMPTSVAAGIEVRLTQLEMQIRELTGKMEETVHGTDELSKRMDRVVKDLEARLAEVKTTPAVVATPAVVRESGSPTQKPVAPAVQEAPKPLGTLSSEDGPSAEKLYESAFADLGKTEYGDAEEGFSKFLSLYPDHKLAANAQYWLAESYYVRGLLNEAAVAFAEGFQKYPDAQKAPDNLLKLGMTLGALGRKQDACLTWAQLERRFPSAPSNIKNRVTQEKARFGCE